MTYSTKWNETYKEGAQSSLWPWSDLVAFAMRHTPNRKSDFRVLELGTGMGANVRFFNEEGMTYYGIDGSLHAINSLKERHPDISDNLALGDFTKDLVFPMQFDLIFDRASIAHNTEQSIRQCLELVDKSLKPNGKFIGIHWFSDACSDISKGVPVKDEDSTLIFSETGFAGVGPVHFSNENHIRDLFSDFEVEILEHSLTTRATPSEGWSLGLWNIVASKR